MPGGLIQGQVCQSPTLSTVGQLLMLSTVDGFMHVIRVGCRTRDAVCHVLASCQNSPRKQGHDGTMLLKMWQIGGD